MAGRNVNVVAVVGFYVPSFADQRIFESRVDSHITRIFLLNYIIYIIGLLLRQLDIFGVRRHKLDNPAVPKKCPHQLRHQKINSVAHVGRDKLAVPFDILEGRVAIIEKRIFVPFTRQAVVEVLGVIKGAFDHARKLKKIIGIDYFIVVHLRLGWVFFRAYTNRCDFGRFDRRKKLLSHCFI